MGIDIHLTTPIEAEWEQFRSTDDERRSFWLSRRFYTFMITRILQEIPAELDQIAELTGVDIRPLYEMMDYYEEQDLEYQLEYEEDKEQVEAARRKNALAKEKLIGNIDRVLLTVEALNRKFSEIKNLPSLLMFDHYKLADSDYYFGDINKDGGSSDNHNLRKDLENLEKHLRYVKGQGVTTVCFFAA